MYHGVLSDRVHPRLSQNIIQGVLVNGSVGRVVGFYKPRDAVEKLGAQIALPESRDLQADPIEAGVPPSSQAEKAQKEQREQRIKMIMSMNTVWPAVQFASGPLMLCVPLMFEVVNADANIEATRNQVRVDGSLPRDIGLKLRVLVVVDADW